MSFADRHNHSNQFTYKLESKDFKKLKDLDPDTVYDVRGIFISKKGKFGDHPVAVGNKFFIDLPQYALNEVKEILASPDDVQAINSQHVGLKTRHYTKDGKDYIGFEWVDIDHKN